MTTRHDCALDGTLLSSLDERICVLDIRHSAPQMRTSSLPLQPGGAQLIRQRRESLSIHVHFAIHAEDPASRSAICQQVCAWAAKGGTLTVSDRSGQQIAVSCTKLPEFSSESWTETLTLTFRSTHCPWWEDAAATSVSFTGETTFTAPGTAAQAPVDALITNQTDAAVTALTLRCGDSLITFEGIALACGDSLVLQTENGLLSARIGNDSILACRSPLSSDLLLAPCGQACSLSAMGPAPLQAVFTVRGRYE